MNLGSAIKQCRKVKKISQTELANLSGLSVSHLSLIESNKREPSVSAVNVIANALGIPVSVLVFLAAKDENLEELHDKHIERLTASIMELMRDDES